MKILLTCILLILFQISFGQGISINNTGALADNSSILDVSSTDMGVLLPRISLTDTLDATTIPNPAHSLIIFNTGTTGGLVEGYYFNKGTAATPYWVELLTNPVSHDLNLGGNKIINLATCTNDNDAANKAYVDAVAGGGGGSVSYGGENFLTWGATEISNMSSGTMNFYRALVYCDSLTEGGHTDWYLPTLEEVKYLAITNISIFNSYPDAECWTTTADDEYGTSTLTFDFYNTSPWVNKREWYNSVYVRCARK